MIVLGVILLLLGLFLPMPLLLWLGVALLVAGAIFALLGTTGHAVGGRRHFY